MAGGFVNPTTGGTTPNGLPATQTDVFVALSAPIPAGTNHIGSISIDGTIDLGSSVTVSNFPSTLVLAAGTAHIGEVSVNSLPAITGTVSVSSIPSVVISSMPSVTGSVSLTGNATVQGSVSVLSLPNVTLANNHVVVDSIPAIQGKDSGGTSRTIATDTTGALLPVTSIVMHSLVNVSANTSTTLLASNANRVMWIVQLTDSANSVLVSETGNSISNMNTAGTLLVPNLSNGYMYSPILSNTGAITAYSNSAVTVRVTEYSKV